MFEPIDPETASFNERLERLLSEYPYLLDLSPTQARTQRNEGRSAFGPVVRDPRAKEIAVPGAAGPMRARVFTPEKPRGVYLHLHGGGWVLGAIDHQDPRLAALSEVCELAVVSIDYRLAPEHPYPAAPDDCETAALWLLEASTTEFGTDRLLIGGESAGAHLAATTLLRLRNRHDASLYRGANLVYGAYDLRLTPSARRWGERLLVLNTPIVEWFANHYVGSHLRDDPDVSPLFADLAGMPPALFTVGTEDPLLDDTLFMYDRWRAAGSVATLAVYPGGAHGFDAFPISLGRRALTRMYEFLVSC